MKRRVRSDLRRPVLLILICLAGVVLIGPEGRIGKARGTAVNTLVRANAASFIRGQSGTVTLDLVALGGANGENAIGFSVNFDTSQLAYVSAVAGSSAPNLLINTSKTATGKVGFAVSRSPGVAFSAGTSQIIVITFTALNTGVLPSTTLTFGDDPIPREVSTVTAGAGVLDVSDGDVTFYATSPYEADTAPRQTGGLTVVVSDWVQAGRFSVGIDSAFVGDEYQRADCAPRNTKGDGAINVSDWVQAGRYSVGLDALVTKGGPTAPPGLQSSSNQLMRDDHWTPARVLALSPRGTPFLPGEHATVEVTLDAAGDENALGFSLSFDARGISFIDATSNLEGATLFVNTRRSGDGHLAIALALPPGARFERGKHPLLNLTFLQNEKVNLVSEISFDDGMIDRQVVSPDAIPLDRTQYQSLRFVAGRPAFPAVISFQNLRTESARTSSKMSNDHLDAAPGSEW